MILTQVLMFGSILLMNTLPNNDFYRYGYSIEATLEADTNITFSSTNVVYYVPSLRFTADLSYDDSDNYYINNIRFDLTVKVYQMPNSNTCNLIDTYQASYSPNWEITQSSYNQYFERLTIGYQTNIADDTDTIVAPGDDYIELRFDYDGNYVSGYKTTFDYVYSDYSSSTFTISSSSFFTEIGKLLGSSYGLGFDDGYAKGEEKGFNDGVAYASDIQRSGEMFTIFNGILNVAAIPINVFLQIFNFEVFGLNISALVSALLSVAVLIIVIRVVTGKKSE